MQVMHSKVNYRLNHLQIRRKRIMHYDAYMEESAAFLMISHKNDARALFNS